MFMYMSWMKILSVLMMIFSSFCFYFTQNWFLTWILFEMNMLGFIYFSLDWNNINTNSLMKYFIIQATSSMIFMMMFCCSEIYLLKNSNNILISMAMIFKLGMFPFHFWLTDVSEGLNWTSFLLFSTWQKILPLQLINNMFIIINSISLMTSLMGVILMMNQTSLRKILVYSSMTHLSWMMISINSQEILWQLYLLIYSISMYSLLMILKKTNLSSINQILFLSQKHKKLLWMNMLNMSSMPPFLMFFPKLIILINVIKISNTLLILMFMMILISLISTYIYLQIILPSMNLMIIKNKKYNKLNNFYFMMLMMMLFFILFNYM